VAALLLGGHGLRLIGTQAGGMHGAHPGSGTAQLLAGKVEAAARLLTGATHKRLAGANGAAIERLTGSGRRTRRRTGARRGRRRGARHGASLLLFEPLNKIGARRNNGARLRLTRQWACALGPRRDGCAGGKSRGLRRTRRRARRYRRTGNGTR
jgi:hypothetical protein